MRWWSSRELWEVRAGWHRQRSSFPEKANQSSTTLLLLRLLRPLIPQEVPQVWLAFTRPSMYRFECWPVDLTESTICYLFHRSRIKSIGHHIAGHCQSVTSSLGRYTPLLSDRMSTERMSHSCTHCFLYLWIQISRSHSCDLRFSDTVCDYCRRKSSDHISRPSSIRQLEFGIASFCLVRTGTWSSVVCTHRCQLDRLNWVHAGSRLHTWTHHLRNHW